MPKGYWIARVDVADAERYKAYIAANAKPLRQFGGRFLVRAGRYETGSAIFMESRLGGSEKLASWK